MHPVYLTLASQTSVKDIKVGVLADMWPGADRQQFPLGAEVVGKIAKWLVTSEARLRFEWPDGYENMFLGDLLDPAFNFRIIANKDGGPVKRRGGGAHLGGGVGVVTTVPAIKEKVLCAYQIGTLQYQQVWEVETEEITVDWRTQPRYPPKLKCDPTHVTDIYAMYLKVGIVWKSLEEEVKFCNARLSGIVTAQDKSSRFTTIGEQLRLRGAILTIALHQHCSRDELFRDKPREFDIFGPPNLGKYGLSKNRLNKLLGLIWKHWEVDESDLDASNQFRYIEHLETNFNDHRYNTIMPGWKLNADELMSWYTGESGDPTISTDLGIFNPKLLPSPDLVPRKPQPVGKEVKCVADGQSGAMMRLEFQRGKVDHKKQPYFAEYGHTVAQSIRLTEPWHNTDRRYDADSWFGGVTACETLKTPFGARVPSPSRALTLTLSLNPHRPSPSTLTLTPSRYVLDDGRQDQLGPLPDQVLAGERRPRVGVVAGPHLRRRQRREDLRHRPSSWRCRAHVHLQQRPHYAREGHEAQGGPRH